MSHFGYNLLAHENEWELMRMIRILINCITAEFQNFSHLTPVKTD